MIRGRRAPALVIGMPVGFVSAAESKALIGGVDAVPWITIRGRRAAPPWSSPPSTRCSASPETRQRQATGLRRWLDTPAFAAPPAPDSPRPTPPSLTPRCLPWLPPRSAKATAVASAATGPASPPAPPRPPPRPQPRSASCAAPCPDFAVECELPNGMRVDFAIDGRVGRIDGEQCAQAVAIKDAGDDPDATHGARLTVEVRRISNGGGVVVLAGGVASAWSPARAGARRWAARDQPVPRRNIIDNVARPAAIPQAGDGLAGDDLGARGRGDGEEDAQRPPRHPRRHQHPRHHRHRPPVFHRGLPRQRDAGDRGRRQPGPDLRGVDHRRAH